jgi:hypothetical protein
MSPIDVLDGAMIVLAIYVMNIVHPGLFLEKVQTFPVYGDTSWIDFEDETDFGKFKSQLGIQHMAAKDSFFLY